MPRTSRMITADEKAVYHVMSRTALDGFPLKGIAGMFMKRGLLTSLKKVLQNQAFAIV